ncbi:hypothetical protein BB558_001675 [Smittium angustum]|uniref:Uncharacterized protein n=1 Tax=Smittium angustum TaxID=133377 RepID=A0A2U1JAQ0_SMIAN|nr:hypothetical protein BB558_001675 [Smittium angustum]
MSNTGVITKSVFPSLLNRTLKSLDKNLSKNLVSGFKATEIYPPNKEPVLEKLPEYPIDSINLSVSGILAKTFMEITSGESIQKSGKKNSFEYKAWSKCFIRRNFSVG